MAAKSSGKKALPGQREQMLGQAEGFLRGARKGQPTHNHAIARELGLAISAEGAGRLYAWMKADPRFVFRPDDLPASFKPAPKRKRKAKASA